MTIIAIHRHQAVAERRQQHIITTKTAQSHKFVNEKILPQFNNVLKHKCLKHRNSEKNEISLV